MMSLHPSVTQTFLESAKNLFAQPLCLTIATGPAPATCEESDTGEVLLTALLPPARCTAPGTISLPPGPWQQAVAQRSGVPGHFRVSTRAGACLYQATATRSEWLLGLPRLRAGHTIGLPTLTWTLGHA
jgi:hypothetical protein